MRYQTHVEPTLFSTSIVLSKPGEDVRRLFPVEGDLREAASYIRSGKLVVVPTETVYGVCALADDSDAIAALFAAKERRPDHPFPVLAATLDDGLAHFAEGASKERARLLAKAFWPGPLTLVAPRVDGSTLVPEALGNLSSVGVRVPGLDVTRRLLREVGRPVCCPSANRSGEPPPASATDLDPRLLRQVEAVVDAGTCGGGEASTVADISDGVTILRAGAISLAQLREALIEPD